MMWLLWVVFIGLVIRRERALRAQVRLADDATWRVGRAHMKLLRRSRP